MDQEQPKISIEKLFCLLCALRSVDLELSIDDERRMKTVWEVVGPMLSQRQTIQSANSQTFVDIFAKSLERRAKFIRLKYRDRSSRNTSKTWTLIDDYSIFHNQTSSLLRSVSSSILRDTISDYHQIGSVSSGIDHGAAVYGTGNLESESSHNPYTANLDSHLASPKEELGQFQPLHMPLCDNNWFRVLIIEPGSFSEPLVGFLKCVLQSEMALQYEALSYCWGEATNHGTPPTNICCNGLDVSISQNLWLALRNIRLPNLRRVIWADALCIDQNNPAERNEQVQAMASIYGNARKTLVWLGDLDPKVARTALSIACQVVNEWDQSHPASYWSKDGPEFSESKLTPIANCDFKDFTETQDLYCLFDSNWFERAWVIQEVVLARSAEVVCPGSRIPWCWIGLASAILRTKYGHIVANKTGSSGIYNSYLIFRLSRHHNLDPVDLSFLHLLRLTSRFRTTEPRDAIFALLGIKTMDNDPGKCPFVSVNYEASLDTLYRQVAEKCLAQNPPLGLLSNAEWAGDYEDIEGRLQTATWIPRWDRKSIAPMLHPWSINTSFRPADDLPFKRFSSTSDPNLTVEGIHVSTVFLIGPRMLSSLDIGEAAIWLLGLPTPHSLSQRNLEICSRTLCGGRNFYGSPESDRTVLIPHFAAFVQTSRYLMDQLTGLSNLAESGDAAVFARTAGNVCFDRRLFITVSGHLGLGPSDTLPGDNVSVLGGATMPFILRQEKSYFRLIGECFVDDIMHGEAVEAARNGSTLNALFDLDALIGFLYSRDSPEVIFETKYPQLGKMSFPEMAWGVIEEIKGELVRRAREKSTVLRVSRIEIH